jgi:hypothetical protein
MKYYPMRAIHLKKGRILAGRHIPAFATFASILRALFARNEGAAVAFWEKT